MRFVFSRKNGQLLSWGTKDVAIDGKTVTLPAVTRKKKKDVLFRDYLTLWKDVGRNQIGRTFFLQVCSTLTARDSKRKSAVNYVVGELVIDSMNELKMVEGVFTPAEKKENMLCLLEKAEYFLKGVFMECHIGDRDDGYHCRNYALQEHSKVESNNLTRRVACRGCLTPFKVLNEVKSYVPVERADALHILKTPVTSLIDTTLTFIGSKHNRLQWKAQQRRFRDRSFMEE